nr:16S rRNA (cytidine(1402)-2'-O)-methyltransferase [Anaerobacterium chartisolvens]
MNSGAINSGTLYLVATPIGNLEDITIRALNILKDVDLIAAEDTRETIKMLNHFDIKKPMVSYYEHNKAEKGNYLIRLLLEGKNIAVVSDAGTPGISDPGEDLVRLAVQSNIKVSMAPGPVAAIMGLVLSGMPTGRFVFEGFLPMNKKQRKQRISDLKDETRTIILYEAPHKLTHTLNDLYEALGDRNITIARELTKRYEEIFGCTLSQAVDKYSSVSPRGEFVLVLEGADACELDMKEKRKWESISIREHVDIYISEGLDKKDAIRKAADDRGVSKRDVYNALL